jgi:hypothetical protein
MPPDLYILSFYVAKLHLHDVAAKMVDSICGVALSLPGVSHHVALAA